MDENYENANSALGYIHRVHVSSVTAVAEVDSASIFRIKVANSNYGGIMYLRNIGNTSIPCKDPTVESTSTISCRESLKSVSYNISKNICVSDKMNVSHFEARVLGYSPHEIQ
jgi:hypothetical protein